MDGRIRVPTVLPRPANIVEIVAESMDGRIIVPTVLPRPAIYIHVRIYKLFSAKYVALFFKISNPSSSYTLRSLSQVIPIISSLYLLTFFAYDYGITTCNVRIIS